MVTQKKRREPIKRSLLSRLLLGLFVLALVGGVLLLGVGYWGYQHLVSQLPDINELEDVQFEEPVRIYSKDGDLISEIGEKRRVPLTIDQIPVQLTEAFISVEDDRYYQHPGVDYQGLIRAALNLIKTGRKGQGGSTITMQVARNFYLSREKTYLRKINEILLALKIERYLDKNAILALYLNKIYLGNRAYGVGAASHVYYGVSVDELTLAQAAMIAGLPKAPSTLNPLANPTRALSRRNHVLNRMFELKKISRDEYETAFNSRITAKSHPVPIALDAGYIAEMARQVAVSEFGKKAYRTGMKVYTTLDGVLQTAATQSVRNNLMAYEQRHGFTGPIEQVPLELLQDAEALNQVLQAKPEYGGILPAVVTEVNNDSITVLTIDRQIHEIPFIGMQWAAKRGVNHLPGDAPNVPSDVVSAGDVIHVLPVEGVLRLVQLPTVEAALVSLDPQTGAINALVGGFDYFRSKFNRATQAKRQAGSTIKPLIYSAALENGDTAASIYNDAPVVFHDDQLEGNWAPENYGGRTYGPTRLREALIKSRNLVSVRVMQDVGLRRTINHLSTFGFKKDALPRDLSLSLGSANVTPVDMAKAYAVFANGGYLIEPYFVDRIEDSRGVVRYQTPRKVVCESEDCQLSEYQSKASRVLEQRNAYIMSSMMQDVIRYGTGKKALSIGRDDLGGKTGTSNDQVDAWFAGFNPQMVTTVWMGFDDNKPLGSKETGSGAALPLWVDFMAQALDGTPEAKIPQPEGIVMVRIDKESGDLARSSNKNSQFEIFREEFVPTKMTRRSQSNQYQPSGGLAADSAESNADQSAGSSALDQLF